MRKAPFGFDTTTIELIQDVGIVTSYKFLAFPNLLKSPVDVLGWQPAIGEEDIELASPFHPAPCDILQEVYQLRH